MPFFRRQSEKSKRRLEKQQYLAQQNPEPVFDISECEISEVPSGVFAMCKVLQKEALLLHDNWISHLASNGKLSDLVTLRVLDIHNNEMKELPNDIGVLENLQVLNVEGNKLKRLPESIGDLSALQTLNVKRNNLHALPESISRLGSLRLLDISENGITSLPRCLCQVRTLENLIVDENKMKYPPKDVCQAGTEEIMKYLCKDYGLEYQPPSNFLLNVLEPPKICRSGWNTSSLKMQSEENKLIATVEQYEHMKERKRLERLELERQLQEEQEEQVQLQAASNSQKRHLLSAITKDQQQLENDLEALSLRREEEKQRLVQSLQEVEHNAEDLINSLLVMNAKARKNEEILEAMEKERIEKDDLFSVRWEEIQNLRRQEVLKAMEYVLNETDSFESSRLKFVSDRQDAAIKALEEETMMAGHQVESVLYNQEVSQKVMLDTLAQQEELQKQAFVALQLQRDAKHSRITNQIMLIEQELLGLTRVEVEKRSLRQESEVSTLAHKRVELTAMLANLMEEREMRQMELQQRLVEMEEQKEQGQTDYWLVQYQRLMDRKPQALIDKERQLEIPVVKILQQAEAQDYIPIFTRHRISFSILADLTEADLKQMGVHELGVRKAILNKTAEYLATDKKLETDVSKKLSPLTPTAPPRSLNSPSVPEAAFPPIPRQLSITARGIHSECSICMDRESGVLFMTCGHVCCCVECAAPLDTCPLCREPITQQVKLHLNQC